MKNEIYSQEFLLARPVLEAFLSEKPVTLLIDELDKSDEEFESFLLEALSDFQISIPELGTILARSKPLVVITSNSLRDFGDALRRRCLYLYLDYPDVETELRILNLKVPGVGRELGGKIVSFIQALRRLDLKKPPSIAETLDFAAALFLLGQSREDEVRECLPALLKALPDLKKVEGKLGGLWPMEAGQA